MKLVNHLTEEEIKEKIRKEKESWRARRWMIIWNVKVDCRPAEEIAKHLGVSRQQVLKIVNLYNKEGAQAIETEGKGGRYNSYLTEQEEKEFLAPFIEKAKLGQIASAKQIKQEFEKRVNTKVEKSTVYRLLDRHNWRKIAPRPSHPKTNPVEQEEFKKTFLTK